MDVKQDLATGSPYIDFLCDTGPLGSENVFMNPALFKLDRIKVDLDEFQLRAIWLFR